MLSYWGSWRLMLAKYGSYEDRHTCLGDSKGKQAPLLFSWTSFYLAYLVEGAIHFTGGASPLQKCHHKHAQKCGSSWVQISSGCQSRPRSCRFYQAALQSPFHIFSARLPVSFPVCHLPLCPHSIPATPLAHCGVHSLYTGVQRMYSPLVWLTPLTFQEIAMDSSGKPSGSP